mgnify:CR=1 FL=1
MITVKATPQPSGKYGDTSCVAGIRIDTEKPSWIRLYPIPFRWLESNSQFSKYDMIEVDIERRTVDTRAESYRPKKDSWTTIGHLNPWAPRHEYISKMEPTTTCKLQKDASADTAAPSLGIVYPTDVEKLEFEDHDPWTPEQIGKMRAMAEQESTALIKQNGEIPAPLIAPRFKVFYRYRCADKSCKGHRTRTLDWELTAFQNRFRQDDHALQTAVEQKFLTEMFAPERESGFFMGNFEKASHRGSFSILGTYWPRTTDINTPTLF